MDAKRFDDLTRSIGNSVSRRQALKLLTTGVLTGIGALIGKQIGKAMPPAQATPTPTPHKIFLPFVAGNCVSVFGNGTPTYEVANADEVQMILETASQDEDFLALQNLLESAGFTSSTQEGASILSDTILTARVVVVHYQPPVPPDQAYLIFGINDCGERIAIVLTFDVDNRVGLGFYRDTQQVVQVEVVSFKNIAAGTDQIKQFAPSQNRPAAVSESCQICLNSCSETQGLRQNSCVLRSAVAAVSTGFTTRKVFREALEETLEEAIDNIGRTASDLNSIDSGLGGIQECIDNSPLDCTVDGRMCGSLCAGCDTTAGVQCQGNKICTGGECRSPCKTADGKYVLCHVTETCSGDGGCVPLSDLCFGNPYMGLYRFGDGVAPACCSLSAFVNCGANIVNGIWAGCCPFGTLCKPIGGGGYGCCTPGLNCD